MREGGWLRVLWGVVLSLLMPGLGQVYAGAWWLGVVVFVLSQGVMAGVRLLSGFVAPGPLELGWAVGLLAVLLVVWVGAAVETGWRVQRREREGRSGEGRVRWVWSTWFAALPALMVAGAVAALPIGWRVFAMRSDAMVPTLRRGDYLVAARRADPLDPIMYGQVVSFTLPGAPEVVHVRRVVGLSGDQLALKRANLVINGRPVGLAADGSMDEGGDGMEDGARRYIETMPNGRRFRVLKRDIEAVGNNTQEFVVPPGNLFVLGDNRDGSSDSRDLGEVGFVSVPDVIALDGTILSWGYWGFRAVE